MIRPWPGEIDVLFVVDADAARTALQAGALCCPRDGCAGRLHPWGRGRPRTVLVRVGERLTLAPDRARCAACRTGQTLMPAWYVPSRSCGIEVIAAALTGHLVDGQGQARVAAGLGLPAATVRGWLRGARNGAGALYRRSRDLAVHAGVDAPAPDRPLWSLHDDTPAVLQALADLARTALAWLHPDRPHRSGSVTGVDYLHLLARADRATSNRWLRLVDPTDARPHLGIWSAINILAGGRLPALLTTAPNGSG